MSHDSYKRLIERLQNAYRPDDNEKVINTVLLRIKKSRLHKLQIRISLYLVFITSAFLAFKPSLNSLVQSATESGFLDYLNLISQDKGSILHAWQDIFFSLTESLPIIEICSLVGIVLILIYFITKMLYDIKSINGYKQTNLWYFEK